MFEERKLAENRSEEPRIVAPAEAEQPVTGQKQVFGAAKIQADDGWAKKAVGMTALIGFAAVWFGGSLLGQKA